MTLVSVWHGDATEMFDLQRAIEHNCTCHEGGKCAAHRALLDQRFIDGVLFARWLLERLMLEEFRG